MLQQLVEGFLLHRESEGRSSKTLDWHRGSLGLFARWIRESCLPEDPEERDPHLFAAILFTCENAIRKEAKGLLLTPCERTPRRFARSVGGLPQRSSHQERLLNASPARRRS